jgi:hypothetical protein
MVSTLRARFNTDIGEFLIVAATDPAASVPGALRFSDEADALRFLELASSGTGAQALGQLYYNLAVGVNNDFSQREIMEAVAKQLAFGMLRAVPVSAIEESEVRSEAVGIDPVHARRLEKFCKERQYLMIVRAGNVESLKHQGQPRHVSKSKDVKLKTAKKAGPDYDGLVTRPMKMGPDGRPLQGPDGKPVFKSVLEWTDDERDNIRKAFEKDYDFDKDGLLRDKHGNAVHGDYDVQGVYHMTHDGYYSQIPVDDALLEHLNREVSPEREMFRHGANDDGSGFKEPGPGSNEDGNVMDYVTMPDGRVMSLMWRKTSDDERFLAFQPTGRTSVLQNAWELKTFLETRGLSWLYTF